MALPKIPKDVWRLIIHEYLTKVDQLNIALTNVNFHKTSNVDKIKLFSSDYIKMIIRHNYQSLLKRVPCRLLENYKYFTLAIKYGHLEIVRWFWEEINVPWRMRIIKELRLYGFRNISDGMSTMFQNRDDDLYAVAASNGHLKLLKFLYYNCSDNDQGGFTYNIWLNAITSNSLDILKWFWENETQKIDRLAGTGYCAYAVDQDHLEILQWLRSIGMPWTKQLCLQNAKSDEMREWISTQPQ
jgi:hypothetical protein